MDDQSHARDRVSLLGRPLPPAFACLVVTVPPGGERRYAACEWRDALVVVERGVVELETVGGERRSFASGTVLCLAGQPLRALHNPGSEPAVLAAVSRRRATGA